MIDRPALFWMKRRRCSTRHKVTLGLAAVVLLALLAVTSTFSIGPRQTGFVLSFGRTARGPVSEPGLYVKWPWQQTRIFNERVRLLICEPAEKLTADHEPLLVQPAAFWRVPSSCAGIVLRTGLSDAEIERLLRDLLWRHVDEQLATYELTSWLGNQLDDVGVARGWVERLEEITKACQREAGNRFAVEIIEVSLIQFNRPPTLHDDIFRQIIADRQREADAIRQDADRRSVELAAAARRRGELFVAAAAQRAGQILHEARTEAGHMARQDKPSSPPATHPATTVPATSAAAP